jgi:hypothetical protein
MSPTAAFHEEGSLVAQRLAITMLATLWQLALWIRDKKTDLGGKMLNWAMMAHMRRRFPGVGS